MRTKTRNFRYFFFIDNHPGWNWPFFERVPNMAYRIYNELGKDAVSMGDSESAVNKFLKNVFRDPRGYLNENTTSAFRKFLVVFLSAKQVSPDNTEKILQKFDDLTAAYMKEALDGSAPKKRRANTAGRPSRSGHDFDSQRTTDLLKELRKN